MKPPRSQGDLLFEGSAGSRGDSPDVHPAGGVKLLGLVLVALTAAPPLAAGTLTIMPTSLPAGTVGTLYTTQALTTTGGNGDNTWIVSIGSAPTGLAITAGGSFGGTPQGCPGYPITPCPNASEPILSNFTVHVTDTAGNSGTASYTVGISWNPTEANFLMTSQQNNAGMVSLVTGQSPAVTVGGHLTIANPVFRQSLTDYSYKWSAFVEAMYASGMRRLNIEPDLDCVYTQGTCLQLYSSALATARALGMSISINPEYSGLITTDCTSIIHHAINSGAGTGVGTYAPGVADWFSCLTNTGISALGGLSLYQWIVVNWLQNGDTFVVLHEPTSMASRWGEAIIPSAACDNATHASGLGNTCPNDWLYNFLYGGGTGAGGGTNLGSNDIIDHVLDCAAGMTPCGSTSVSITVGVTTWLDEDSQSPAYASVFAPGLKSSVPMGLDMYFFSCCGSGTNVATWQGAIASAALYSHPTFVEEFAMPRWVQMSPGIFNSEANAIKGALSCEWEPSYSHNLANFLAAFLPWISSTGATSASMFDPEVLSRCAAVYPDNPNNPTANNIVLQNATTNFLNHSYSAGFYRLSSIITNWSRNSLSGAVLSRGALH